MNATITDLTTTTDMRAATLAAPMADGGRMVRKEQQSWRP